MSQMTMFVAPPTVASDPRAAARHLVARARGVVDSDGSDCACCGLSPFASSRPVADMFGDNFTDWTALLGTSGWVCAGCVSLLSGRPGDVPPPLRTVHCLAVAGGPAVYPKTGDLAAILRSPPSEPFVLVWAPSMKRHAVLRAGVSSADAFHVGGDSDSITYLPSAHVAVLDAVEALLAAFPRDDIKSGGYSSLTIASFGPRRWLELEAQVAPIRPSPLLDFISAVARRPDPDKTTPPSQEQTPMIDIDDIRAGELLSYIAEASRFRRTNGLDFWRSVLRRRVALAASMPLRDAVASLMTRLQCESGPALEQAIAILDAMPHDEVSRQEHALRRRAPIICAYAHAAMKARVEARLNATTITTDTP